MKRFVSCLIAFVMLLCSFSVAAEEGVAWNGENSIIVTVMADSDKSFAPSDFPEVDCSAVIVVSKKIENDGFVYELILQLDTMDDGIMQAVEDVMDNSAVTGAKRNVFDYIDPILILSDDKLTIRVGESADVTIDVFDTYANSGFYYGVIFTLDPDVADVSTMGFEYYPIMAQASNRDLYDALVGGDLASGLVGEKLTASPINVYYTCISEFGVGGEEGYIIIEAVNDMLSKDGVIAAKPLGMEFPCARMPGEQWTIIEEYIASLSLSGGEAVGVPENLIGQTATVTGVSVGETVLSLSTANDGQSATADCVIRVINSGDANYDGVLDNMDAAAVLKHDAGLTEMSEELIAKCDMNSDGVVDNLDATVMLKYDAGLI